MLKVDCCDSQACNRNATKFVIWNRLNGHCQRFKVGVSTADQWRQSFERVIALLVAWIFARDLLLA